jgi:hypothetical protein
MTKPTPKERVLKRWPDADCIYVGDAPNRNFTVGYTRHTPDHAWPDWIELGFAPTPAAAWRDAAERMK